MLTFAQLRAGNKARLPLFRDKWGRLDFGLACLEQHLVRAARDVAPYLQPETIPQLPPLDPSVVAELIPDAKQ